MNLTISKDSKIFNEKPRYTAEKKKRLLHILYRTDFILAIFQRIHFLHQLIQIPLSNKKLFQ
jgi:hypothetical protein